MIKKSISQKLIIINLNLFLNDALNLILNFDFLLINMLFLLTLLFMLLKSSYCF